jgi:ectoine hydroxylase-related dioxygenase (phytanoyl-CoA dioxygenase family)
MPIDSGPTQLLPFSQHFDNGYIAYRHPEFIEVFNETMVQLSLQKGDGLFFNPALFHAAGENRTKDFNRSANLLQISACWGKPMESVDRRKIMELIWPVLRGGASEELGEKRVEALLKAVADGYSFPTNLDTDPPPEGGVSLISNVDLRKLMRCSTVRRHNSTWPL